MADKKVRYVTGSIRYEPNPPPEEKQKVFYISPMGRGEENVEEFWDRIKKEDAAEARHGELMAKLQARRLQAQKELQDAKAALRPEGEKGSKEGKDPNKKYDVNPETGAIDVVGEGEGEYTYKEALIVSSSRKGQRGEYEGAIALLKAAQDLGGDKDRPPSPKKGFDVDDDTAEIIPDPEHGQLTLSEAKAVSASKRKLLRGSDDTINPDRLELKLRDLKDEWKQTIVEMEGRLRQRLTSTDQENPFTLDDKGEITLNRSAKVSATDLLLWQLIKERRAPVLDERGNLIKVADTATWLEVQRHERKEKREDKKNDEIISFIADGRRQLPAILETLRGRSKETEESMKKGGWLGEGKSEVMTDHCPNPKCSEILSYTSIPCIVTCKCGTLAFFGTQAQFQIIQSQIGQPKGEAKPEESKAGGELRESGTASPASSGVTNAEQLKPLSD
jgi:hypothetical protein